ncbi:MAG: helix-turn-helix domain-containing protein [Pseudonocardia sp.]|nr:helix-turn-helix domain-containing protein [Pseudonocardia sp.]
MLGMSPMTVYRAIAAGEFPAVRIRGRLIVPARAIEEMVEAALADQSLVDAAGWVPEQHGRGV